MSTSMQGSENILTEVGGCFDLARRGLTNNGAATNLLITEMSRAIVVKGVALVLLNHQLHPRFKDKRDKTHCG